jgi:hypothetical protein
MHLVPRSARLRFTIGIFAAAVTAALAGSLPAQAAQIQARPPLAQVVPASCGTPNNHEGRITIVAVVNCGGVATAMGAATTFPVEGHFEFYGPHGFIANSPVGVYALPNSAIVDFGAQSAPVGSKWCARFWEATSNGPVLLDNNCVTL